MISGGDYVTGHDLDSGKELWRIGGFNPTDNPVNRTIASSVVIGGNVFTTSTRGRPFIAFRAGGSGDITGKNELWTNNLGADVPTPTTDGKYIYVLVDNGIALRGSRHRHAGYPGKRIELGTYSSSPLLADGKIYSTNEEGTTTVVKAGPAFEVLGRQQARQSHARQPGGGGQPDLHPNGGLPVLHPEPIAPRGGTSTRSHAQLKLRESAPQRYRIEHSVRRSATL